MFGHACFKKHHKHETRAKLIFAEPTVDHRMSLKAQLKLNSPLRKRNSSSTPYNYIKGTTHLSITMTQPHSNVYTLRLHNVWSQSQVNMSVCVGAFVYLQQEKTGISNLITVSNPASFSAFHWANLTSGIRSQKNRKIRNNATTCFAGIKSCKVKWHRSAFPPDQGLSNSRDRTGPLFRTAGPGARLLQSRVRATETNPLLAKR